MADFYSTVNDLLDKGYSVRDAHKEAHKKFPNNEVAKALSFIQSQNITNLKKKYATKGSYKDS